MSRIMLWFFVGLTVCMSPRMLRIFGGLAICILLFFAVISSFIYPAQGFLWPYGSTKNGAIEELKTVGKWRDFEFSVITYDPDFLGREYCFEFLPTSFFIGREDETHIFWGEDSYHVVIGDDEFEGKRSDYASVPKGIRAHVEDTLNLCRERAREYLAENSP